MDLAVALSCERKCIVDSEVVCLDEGLFADSLVSKTSDEAIANEFVDARRSIARACSEGSQIGDKLQAICTDVLVTSFALCAAVDCRLAWLKAMANRVSLIVADVCKA